MFDEDDVAMQGGGVLILRVALLLTALMAQTTEMKIFLKIWFVK